MAFSPYDMNLPHAQALASSNLCHLNIIRDQTRQWFGCSWSFWSQSVLFSSVRMVIAVSRPSRKWNSTASLCTTDSGSMPLSFNLFFSDQCQICVLVDANIYQESTTFPTGWITVSWNGLAEKSLPFPHKLLAIYGNEESGFAGAFTREILVTDVSIALSGDDSFRIICRHGHVDPVNHIICVVCTNATNALCNVQASSILAYDFGHAFYPPTTG